MNDDTGYESWVVLLAGGIGSRFWPASTPRRPKQFLALASARPLIVDTIERARALAPTSNILIATGESFRTHLQEQLPEFPSEQIIAEPAARGTAPALAWAASQILTRAKNPDRAVMVSLHSDHLVRPMAKFESSLARAVDAAARLDRLLTVGVAPTRPETGYGYIELGDELTREVFEVRRFVEKPDRESAERFIAGGLLWNSGIFAWRPQLLLAELAEHTPEIADELSRLEEGDISGFFDSVPSLTIDHGLMERSSRAAVVRAEFEWDDLGTWAALMRLRELDGEGNLLLGQAHTSECSGSLLWAEDGPVVAFGMSDVVVVRASGITFVAPLERAAELKHLLETLPLAVREPD